jgi:DNA-directed RNA polymerase III subunit RPC1
MEKDRREFLKKMRNPRADALQKSATMKKVRDKCKLSCCPRCDYRNGKLSYIVHNYFTL